MQAYYGSEHPQYEGASYDEGASDVSMRLFFVLVATGLALAAALGAVSSWDGGYFLFKLLDDQAPFVVHARLFVLPIHTPTILASYVTDDIGLLRTVLGLSYASLTFLALAISWWIARANNARSLFVWAVLGIALGMLPGQFSLTTEAIVACNLFWPVLIALLTGPRGLQVPVVGVIAIFILFTHPFAVALFAFAVVVCCVVSLRFRGGSHRKWLWACLFGALAVLALLRSASLQSGYEAEQLNLDTLSRQFTNAIAGLPLVALLLSFVAAVIVLLAPRIKGRGNRTLTLTLYVLELLCLLGAGVALLLWAANPYLWRTAISFRSWALIISGGFMLLAVGDALLRPPGDTSGYNLDWTHRSRAAHLIALFFLLVLGTQSLVWSSLEGRLQSAVAGSGTACLPATSLPWLGRTPLNHWSVTARSLLLQGRRPSSVVMLEEQACASAASARGLSIARFNPTSADVRGWQGGWFNLDQLKVLTNSGSK